MYFLKFVKKKDPFFNFIFHFLQLFSADTTYNVFITILTLFFAPEKMKKTPLKVAYNRPRPFFLSTVNQPKSSPNLNSCSIKIFHHGTSL